MDQQLPHSVSGRSWYGVNAAGKDGSPPVAAKGDTTHWVTG